MRCHWSEPLEVSPRDIPTVEGLAGAIVALSSKAALGDVGATLIVRLEPDQERCSQRHLLPSSAEEGSATVTRPVRQRLRVTRA